MVFHSRSARWRLFDQIHIKWRILQGFCSVCFKCVINSLLKFLEFILNRRMVNYVKNWYLYLHCKTIVCQILQNFSEGSFSFNQDWLIFEHFLQNLANNFLMHQTLKFLIKIHGLIKDTLNSSNFCISMCKKKTCFVSIQDFEFLTCFWNKYFFN